MGGGEKEGGAGGGGRGGGGGGARGAMRRRPERGEGEVKRGAGKWLGMVWRVRGDTGNMELWDGRVGLGAEEGREELGGGGGGEKAGGGGRTLGRSRVRVRFCGTGIKCVGSKSLSTAGGIGRPTQRSILVTKSKITQRYKTKKLMGSKLCRGRRK